MQKHKHRSNSKTKENPSSASGLQGKDSMVSNVETHRRRVRRQRGLSREEEAEGDEVVEVTRQARNKGCQVTGIAAPSPSFVKEGSSRSPGPLQMTPHPTGVLTGTRRPRCCQGALGQLLPWPPPQPAHSRYVNTALFSSVTRHCEEVCSPPAALPYHPLLVLSGLTPPLHPLTSLLVPPPRPCFPPLKMCNETVKAENGTFFFGGHRQC